MSRILDTVFPRRLGAGFRWLVASSWVSNLGDGLALAAGPLVVASLTTDARLVALGATMQWLPPLLFGLLAGAVSDRLDRRRVIITVNLVRVGVLAVLATALATGQVSILAVLGALFLLGTSEVFVDNTTSTILPMIAHRDDLTVGNARLQAGYVTINQLAGPPVGAALFTLGAMVPFASQAILVLGATVLVSRLRLPPHGKATRAPSRIHHDIVEGFRWAVRHGAVRTLILTVFIFNLTFGAAWSVLVLYATRHLGLGEIGFGLITTVQAVGGVVGIAAYGWLTRRVSLSNLMRAGLILETFTHLGLAATDSPAVAMPIFFVFGVHVFVWGTTSITIRQRVVPTELQGRVNSVNLVGVFGGLVIGSAVGGILAERVGVTAPFWYAFVGSAIFVVLIWRQLRHLSVGDAPTLEEVGSDDDEAPDPAS
ncbi:MAG: MFS transporter [Actinomycetales bacterium]|nr:MFS transporter [Actinomycetales bacterium]